jgi:hypothetical protein
MTVRIEKDGWVITGSTRAELQMGIEAMQRALQQPAEETPKRGPGRPPKNGVSKAKQTEQDSKELALGFLRALNEAGRAGITSDRLAEAVKLTNRRALGPTVRRVDGLLRELDIKRSTVFTVSPGRRKVWTAQPDILTAIDRIEQMDDHHKARK